MINKLLVLVISCTMLFNLTACKNEINIDKKPDVETENSTYIVDTSDLEAIGRKYVDIVYRSGVGIHNSWDNPNEIDPTNLFLCFVFNDYSTELVSSEKILNPSNNGFYYEIDTVYEGLSKYFDFDKAILKNTEYYDEDLEMLFHQGIGAVVGIDYTVINAKQTGDILEIHYNIDGYDGNDPHLSCFLKIKIIEDDNFKYLSYYVEDNKDYLE